VYSNDALVTRIGENGLPSSSSSQPSVVATMLESLDVHPGMRVLEIGAGTGYNAALLAELTGDAKLVTTIDIQSDVVEQTAQNLARMGYIGIDVRAADGFFGAPDAAPFDRIIVTVGPSDLSPHWVEQLASDGIVLTPLTLGGWHPNFRIRRDGDVITGRFAGWTGFMAMTGVHPREVWEGRESVRAPDAEHLQKRAFEPVLDMEAFVPLWFFAALHPDVAWLVNADAPDASGFGFARDETHWASMNRNGVHSCDAPDLVNWLTEFVPVGEPSPDVFARVERAQYTQCIRLEPRAEPGR